MGEYYITKSVQDGRRQGIQEGMQEGMQQGLYDGARAFVEVSIRRGFAADYILDMVQECFKFSRKEAERLYEECSI